MRLTPTCSCLNLAGSNPVFIWKIIMPRRNIDELPYSSAAARVIGICGGTAAVAKMTGLDKSSVSRWKRRSGGKSAAGHGYIPIGFAHLLIIEARKEQIHLTCADFFDLSAFEAVAAGEAA